VPGALAGVVLVVERRVRASLAVAVSSSADVARAASRPALVQRALRPLEDWIWTMNEIARREQARNRAEAAALIPMIVQQVTENVLAQLDLVRIVEQVPIEDIVEHVDLEAIVQRIDLGGVIRESTTRCARRGWHSTRSAPRWSTGSCSAANPASSRSGSAAGGDPQRARA
jgi:hypothetical protein